MNRAFLNIDLARLSVLSIQGFVVRSPVSVPDLLSLVGLLCPVFNVFEDDVLQGRLHGFKHPTDVIHPKFVEMAGCCKM